MGKGDDEDPDSTYRRQVSSFYLDRFEVTVGRFAVFFARYAVPRPGAGAHPRFPNSGWQEGWETAPDYDHEGQTAVPPSKAALQTQLSALGDCGPGSTWDAGDQSLPINCVNWYVAFAFCAFDGGRLPTEAEWNYAAAFGDAHRPYPWSESVSDLVIDETFATYYDFETLLERPVPVGSHLNGQGGFRRNAGQGHEDLAGNVAEWTGDGWLDVPPPTCDGDCMAAWPDGDQRVIRGGSLQTDFTFLRSGSRTWAVTYDIQPSYGIRCARDTTTSLP
jgi:formylglycine-generating enzyme required for sulfatase activity